MNGTVSQGQSSETGDGRDKQADFHFPTRGPANVATRRDGAGSGTGHSHRTMAVRATRQVLRSPQLPFDAVSPVNGRHYTYKTVEAVFADNPASIVVVTVKVYYHD